MTKYLLETDEDRWLAFKLTATKRGQRIKDAVVEAIDLYVQAYAEEVGDLKIEIVKTEEQRNLKAIIDEAEILDTLQRLTERRKKKSGYDAYAVDLRNSLLSKLKKGIVLTDRIAQELRAYAHQCEGDLPPEVVKAINALSCAQPISDGKAET